MTSIHKYFRKICVTGLVLTSAIIAHAQCQMLPASTICGDINPGVTVITASPACFQSTVVIHLTSDVRVDSICMVFGDGRDTIILNPDTAFNVTHNYNFPPPDNCPGGDPYPGIQCIIQANFYKHCPGNGFSFNFKSTSLSFRFKPRVKFPFHNTVLCSNACITIPLDSSCTNTYWQTDSTSYTWTFGDTSQAFTVLHTPFGYYQSPMHCYNTAGSYLMVLTAENGCGTEADTARVTIQKIDSVQIPRLGHLCTGSPVTVHLVGENISNFHTFIFPGYPNDTIIGAGTSDPQLIFRVPGTYTVAFASGACVIDTTITVESGATVTHDDITDTCFDAASSVVLSDYYFTSSALQINHISVFDTAGIIFQSIDTGFPSTPVHLPHAGRYIIIDTSFTTCDTVVFPADTFNLLAVTAFILPHDTAVCLQSTFVLPTFAGTRISLDGMPLLNDTVFVDSVRLYQFVYTPVCGNSAVFTITGKGTKARGLDSSFCAMPGMIALTGLPAGGVFSGPFIANGQFDGNAAGTGSHAYTYAYTDLLQGCTYLDTSYINIYQPMNVSYLLTDTVCSGTPAIYVNSDSTQSNRLNFGDGTGNFTGNPIAHTYTQAGLQQVVIQITDLHGCADLIADSVRVLPLPEANFILPAAVCDSIVITPVLSLPVVAGYIYTWYYGGDSSFSAPDILVRDTLYNIVNYTVSLHVTSPQCGSISQSVVVSVLPQTKANFGLIYQANCSPMELHFAQNSRGDSLSYAWYVNGNLFSNAAVPPLEWLTADGVDSVYHFKLIVCSASCGCDTFTDSVTVHPVNFAVCFRPDSFSVCQGRVVSFKDCGRNYCSLLYNFGDGQDTITQSGQTVSHTYTLPGSYTVWLTVTCNCMTDSASQQIVIKPAPGVIPAVANSGCSGHVADFTAQVTSGNPVYYQWNFGDGVYSSVANTTHTYADSGTYNGWLYAVGSNFCYSDTARFSIPVVRSPNASFIRDTQVCQGSLLQIGVDTFTVNSTYVWHVVTGTDSLLATTLNGSFNFNTADTGTYRVWLQAFNNADPTCSTMAGNMRVEVMPTPVARFTVTPLESNVGQDFNFYNQSSNAISYWWNFGDGDSSFDVNPVHRYAQPAWYNITLVAINNLCRDTAANRVLVNPGITIFIPNTIIANGDGNNDRFQVFGNLEAVHTLRVRIFDRAGEEVFSSNEIQFKWDGTYKGKVMSSAVFVYEIEMNIVGEEKKPPRLYKGSITVLR